MAVGDSGNASFTIEGVDGSRWYIHGPGSDREPVFLEKSSVGELYDAPVATHYKARVGQPGSMYQGHRYLERHITLTLATCGDTPLEWAQVDSSLRRAFSYEDYTVIRCTTELSGSRALKVRLESEPEYKEEQDPHFLMTGRWVFKLIADDPFWEGEEYRDTFEFDGTNWAGGGVMVHNPGDVYVWPKWVLTSPAKFVLPDSSYRDDADKDRLILLPTQNAGTDLLVDTDPVEEMVTAVDGNGGSPLVWAQMNGQFFMNPIPPHTSMTLAPVQIDPLPTLNLILPDTWRLWIIQEIGRWARSLGRTAVARKTADDVAQEVRRIVTSDEPAWVGEKPGWIFNKLTALIIASEIRKNWSKVSGLVGATAQVRLRFRWSRPWGME
ncbi:hypothetical protein [Corynebacterium macclintockiae]|uniref:hypothetical protein n=1 Tax=Corynebacterium macclintockiae TaxID=2913501 RepID=UPI003EB9FB9B